MSPESERYGAESEDAAFEASPERSKKLEDLDKDNFSEIHDFLLNLDEEQFGTLEEILKTEKITWRDLSYLEDPEEGQELLAQILDSEDEAEQAELATKLKALAA